MHKTVDPQDISLRLSDEEYQKFVQDLFKQGDGNYRSSRKLEKLLKRLPPIESETLRLNHLKKVKQTSLARIFNVSQPTIHTRLSKAMKRLRFLSIYPDIAKGEFHYHISRYLSVKDDRYWELYRTTSYVNVANKYNTSVTSLKKIIKKVKTSAEWASNKSFYETMELLYKNPEILSGENNIELPTEDLIVIDRG
jgi:hypothetical protein